MNIWIVFHETNNNTDMSSSDPFRYTPSIIGVYDDLKKAENKAFEYLKEVIHEYTTMHMYTDALYMDIEDDTDESFKTYSKHLSIDETVKIYNIFINEDEYNNRMTNGTIDSRVYIVKKIVE